MILQSVETITPAYYILGFVATFLPLLVILFQIMTRFYNKRSNNSNNWHKRALQAVLGAGGFIVAIGYTSADIIKIQTTSGRLESVMLMIQTALALTLLAMLFLGLDVWGSIRGGQESEEESSKTPEPQINKNNEESDK